MSGTPRAGEDPTVSPFTGFVDEINAAADRLNKARTDNARREPWTRLALFGSKTDSSSSVLKMIAHDMLDELGSMDARRAMLGDVIARLLVELSKLGTLIADELPGRAEELDAARLRVEQQVRRLRGAGE